MEKARTPAACVHVRCCVRTRPCTQSCASHLHGVVPQIMMWYLPILLLLNMV
jgi:hypothetical protein